MLGTVLLVILILFLVGGITPLGNIAGRGPYWGAGYGWGGGGVGLILLILVILLLTGHRF